MELRGDRTVVRPRTAHESRVGRRVSQSVSISGIGWAFRGSGWGPSVYVGLGGRVWGKGHQGPLRASWVLCRWEVALLSFLEEKPVWGVGAFRESGWNRGLRFQLYTIEKLLLISSKENKFVADYLAGPAPCLSGVQRCLRGGRVALPSCPQARASQAVTHISADTGSKPFRSECIHSLTGT